MNGAVEQIFLPDSQMKKFSDFPDLGFSISGRHSCVVRSSGGGISQPTGHKERAGKRKGSDNTILPSMLRSTLHSVSNIRFIIPAVQYPIMAPARAILIPHHSSGGPFLFPFCLVPCACMCISPPRNPPCSLLLERSHRDILTNSRCKINNWCDSNHLAGRKTLDNR